MGGRNKYGAIKTVFDGRTFDSKREATYAAEYGMLKKAGEIVELEFQPVLILVPKPNLIKYIPDFRIVWRNGNEEYVDVKGMETDVFRLKKKLMAHFHPDKKLVIVN